MLFFLIYRRLEEQQAKIICCKKRLDIKGNKYLVGQLTAGTFFLKLNRKKEINKVLLNNIVSIDTIFLLGGKTYGKLL